MPARKQADDDAVNQRFLPEEDVAEGLTEVLKFDAGAGDFAFGEGGVQRQIET
jgi:hypothetical protein